MFYFSSKSFTMLPIPKRIYYYTPAIVLRSIFSILLHVVLQPFLLQTLSIILASVACLFMPLFRPLLLCLCNSANKLLLTSSLRGIRIITMSYLIISVYNAAYLVQSVRIYFEYRIHIIFTHIILFTW